MPTMTDRSAPGAPSQLASSLRVYNTLSGKKEPFQTERPGQVGMYLCGPTVYKEAHIGHMVGPVIFDTVKRYLVYNGYRVDWVVNITDVDDKLIAESQRRGISMAQVAAEMTEDYLKNLQALGVDQIDHFPKATEHIDEIIQFIETLIARGYAYAAGSDVYFDVARDAEYGKLSHRTLESLQGEGGEAASRKRAPGDFALWKGAKPGEPSWESPWGAGRPGWHIECSAMSRKLLGETFDIHGGGLDLVFPHHENEIAQSECCHGKPMVRYWMHNGLMKADSRAGKVGGRSDREEGADPTAGKISRSKGAGGLAQLIQKHGGERIRFFLLRTHYRSTSVFGDEPLTEAATALETFYRFFDRLERITGQSFYKLAAPATRWAGEFEAGGNELLTAVHERRRSFLEKMDDDFNTGGGVSELFELVRTLNRYVEQHRLEDVGQRTAELIDPLLIGTRTLKELSAILGVFQQPAGMPGGAADELVGQLMQLLIDARAQARQKKDFAMADLIRVRLLEMNISLEDRKDGTTWRRGEG
ncbi:MAG: cysteine--tRNA ligase [Pirellulales bacterium]